ncbi:MAG: PH domain-containing protein [Bacteroidota bacterium]
MRFEAKKDTAFLLPLVIPTGIGFLVALYFALVRSSWVAGIALAVSLIVFYAIYYFWTHTYYEIKNDQLHYQSVSVKGQIPLRKINRIETANYPTSGSPALAFQGLMIYYSGGKEVFVSPKEVDPFLAALKGGNRRIKVSV